MSELSEEIRREQQRLAGQAANDAAARSWWAASIGQNASITYWRPLARDAAAEAALRAQLEEAASMTPMVRGAGRTQYPAFWDWYGAVVDEPGRGEIFVPCYRNDREPFTTGGRARRFVKKLPRQTLYFGCRTYSDDGNNDFAITEDGRIWGSISVPSYQTFDGLLRDMIVARASQIAVSAKAKR